MNLMICREKQDLCSDKKGSPVYCCKDDMCSYPVSFYSPTLQSAGHGHGHSRLPFDTNGKWCFEIQSFCCEYNEFR